MAPSPRVDELRKRLEKEPNSRLFAQLAEELRKGGELEEAIAVCREGLGKHPAYPSARMTLGRALKDSGDLEGARAEFETVVKGAPDNILASRLLGECLEGLGRLEAALERFRATLTLVPGDAQVLERIDAIETSMAAGSAEAPAAGVEEAEEATPEAPAEADEPEVPAPEVLAPVKLVEVDEDFELERAHEAPIGARVGTGAAEAPTLPAPERTEAPAPAPIADDAAQGAQEREFELEPGAGSLGEPSTLPFRPAPPPEVVEEAAPAAEVPAREPEPEEPEAFDEDFETLPPRPAPAASLPSGAPAAPPLATMTLGELYAQQGHLDEAIETYRQVISREPGNQRAAARLSELEARAHPVAAGAPAGPGRREATQRTIARLEEFLDVVRRHRA